MTYPNSAGLCRRSFLKAAAGVALTAPALAGRSFAAELQPVTIALSSKSFAAAAVFLAEELGLFEKNGIRPKLVVMESGSVAVTASLSGSAQFSVAGVSDAIAASVRGQRMKLIANVYHGLSGSLTLAKKTAAQLGVSADSPLEARWKALKGLSIAIPSPTSSYVPPVVGAAEAGGGKVNFVYMAQPAMSAALETGSVQGIMCASPFWVPAVMTGAGILFLDGPSGDFPPKSSPVSTLALEATADYAKSHPSIIKAAQATFDDLAALIGKDPAAVRAALARVYPKLDAKTLDLSFTRNGKSWAHPTFTAEDVRHEIDSMEQTRHLPGLGDLDPKSMLVVA